MKSNRGVVLSLVGLLCVATCKPKPQATTEAGTDAAVVAMVDARPPPYDAGPPPVFTLASVSNKPLSFDIQLPVGYKTVTDDGSTAVYSFPLDPAATKAITIEVTPHAG